ATQLVSRLRDALGVELSVRAVFEAQTVADLADCVDTARAQASAVPTAIVAAGATDPDQARPLSLAQERLWFLDQLETGKPFYIVPLALQLRGQLDIAALRTAINGIVRRHEVLRTCFPAVEGRPSQRIAPDLTIALPVQDLSHLPDAA